MFCLYIWRMQLCLSVSWVLLYLPACLRKKYSFYNPEWHTASHRMLEICHFKSLKESKEKVLEITLSLNEREKEGTWPIYNWGVFHSLLSGRLLFCYMQHAEDLISFYTSLLNIFFFLNLCLMHQVWQISFKWFNVWKIKHIKFIAPMKTSMFMHIFYKWHK